MPPTDRPSIDPRPGAVQAAYSAQAALPSLLAALALTAAVLTGHLYLAPVERMAADLGYLAQAGLAGAVWVFQGVRWGYRVAFFGYRLDGGRLHLRRGPLYPKSAAVDLTGVAEVRVGRNPAERLLNVGTVRLSAGGETVVIPGVFNPAALAEALRSAARPERAFEAVDLDEAGESALAAYRRQFAGPPRAAKPTPAPARAA